MGRARLSSVMAGLVGLLAMASMACGSTPDRIAFNSLQTIKAAAESGMTVAGALYADGKISEAQKAQLIDAYIKLERSCKAAAAIIPLVQTDKQAEVVLEDARRLLAELQRLIALFTPRPVARAVGGRLGAVWA